MLQHSRFASKECAPKIIGFFFSIFVSVRTNLRAPQQSSRHLFKQISSIRKVFYANNIEIIVGTYRIHMFVIIDVPISVKYTNQTIYGSRSKLGLMARDKVNLLTRAKLDNMSYTTTNRIQPNKKDPQETEYYKRAVDLSQVEWPRFLVTISNCKILYHKNPEVTNP